MDDMIAKSLLDISNGIGDLKEQFGVMSGKVDQAVTLHRDCPARLGFEALKEKTNKIRTIKDSDPSIVPPSNRANYGAALKTIWPLITGILLGAAAVGALLARVL